MLGLKSPRGCVFDHSTVKYVRIESGLYDVVKDGTHLGSVAKGDHGWELIPAAEDEWLSGFKTRAQAADWLISWNV